MKLRFHALVAALALTIAAPLWAATPESVIADMSSKMLQGLGTPTPPSPSQVNQLVDEVVMPHLDFEVVTARAAGRHWRQATPEQRAQLQVAFRGLLLKAYSGALQQAKGASVRVLPTRESDPSFAVIRTEVRAPGQIDPIAISYRLEPRGADWQVVDLGVMNVWLVSAYRDSFTQEIDRNGIDGLIKRLNEKLGR